MELEDVFREHQGAVFAYFVRVVGNRHDAEELTQETFYRACGAALRYRGDAPIRAWLFGIARRVLMEASRHGIFDQPFELEDEDLGASDPDHATRMDLEAAFATLARSDRETLMLVDYLGFNPADAAALMTVDPHTFRMRLHRARGRLRQRLEVRTP